MTDEIKDGGPAYPVPTGVKERTGMSLRDWFAGQALVGLGDEYSVAAAAKIAYQYADAMLAARGRS